MAVTLDPHDSAAFRKLDYWQQWDAMCGHAARPETSPLKLMLYFVGMALAAMHVAVVYVLTEFVFPGPSFTETFVKNLIAWTSVAYQLGLDQAYWPLATNWGPLNKWKVGTLKITGLGHVAARRTLLDLCITILFTASRLFMIASPQPTALCGGIYLFATVVLAVTDWTQFLGSYGYLNGLWAFYLCAKYAAVPRANALLQIFLMVLYISCGIGKMGPWFTQVFCQEWTLPAWAAILDLRWLLYGANFPHDNTPTMFASFFGYIAATAEWAAPLGWLFPASVVGGMGQSGWLAITSPAVAFGSLTLVAMHIYIVAHMPAFDVWLLNVVPGVLTPYAFHLAPSLSEPGFDFAALASLPVSLKLVCAALVAYVLYGHMRPSRVSYVFAYRFWAGNWPMGYVLLKRSAQEKLYKRWPQLAKTGPVAEVSQAMEPDEWKRLQVIYGMMGAFQTAQLPHRMMPLLMHKVLGGQRITEFDGTVAQSFFASYWLAGNSINETMSDGLLFREAHKECAFEEGECVWIECKSFPLLAHLWGGKALWQIHDAKLGLTDSGSFTVAAALAVTRPSILRFWAEHPKRA